MVDDATLRAVNEAFAKLPISPERLAELPVEVRQFIAIAERLRQAHVFETEPASFLRELEAQAWQE